MVGSVKRACCEHQSSQGCIVPLLQSHFQQIQLEDVITGPLDPAPGALVDDVESVPDCA